MGLLGTFMSQITQAQDLKSHQWENRIILMVSHSEESKEYQAQIAQFSKLPRELKERKMLIYQVLPEQYRIMNYQINAKENKWVSSPVLFTKFANKKEDFKVILIGLDGGVKLEASRLVTASELFETIDSMPMRRAELNERRN